MKDKFWSDLNRELWRSAAENVPPRNFIRAELWHRVEHQRMLEKSAAIRMARKTQPLSAAYRACSWLVESGPIGTNSAKLPENSAFDPENAVVPQSWPDQYPGVHPEDAAQIPEESTLEHYDLLVHAFVYAAQAAQIVGLDPKSFDFELNFTKHRWIVQGSDIRPFARISVNFYYIAAPPKIWNALFAAIVKSHAPSRSIAEKYAQSSQAQALLAVYADISPLIQQDAYDLSAMFDSLNAEFFNQTIPRPILAWTSREQYHTLGSYNYHWNIILISKLLNRREVPEFVVRFILYHEMLHIKHGAYRDKTGLRAHTPAFRADERSFPRYEEAEHYISHLRENLGLNR